MRWFITQWASHWWRSDSYDLPSCCFLSLQAHPEYVRDQDRRGPSESLDPPVPGEEAALSAPQTAAFSTSLNEVSNACDETSSLTLTLRQTPVPLYEMQHYLYTKVTAMQITRQTHCFIYAYLGNLLCAVSKAIKWWWKVIWSSLKSQIETITITHKCSHSDDLKSPVSPALTSSVFLTDRGCRWGDSLLDDFLYLNVTWPVCGLPTGSCTSGTPSCAARRRRSSFSSTCSLSTLSTTSASQASSPPSVSSHLNSHVISDLSLLRSLLFSTSWRRCRSRCSTVSCSPVAALLHTAW